MSERVAVVTGANKGIGFAIVKALCKRFKGIVYLTSRDEERGRGAVAELNKLNLHPVYHQLDVTCVESVLRFKNHIIESHGGLDILINNAAVANCTDFYNSYEENKNVVNITYKSILVLQEHIFALVRDNGRIINISSDCGHLSNLRNKQWIERLSRKDLTVEDINDFVDWFLESCKNKTFKNEDFADEGTMVGYRVAKIALSAITILQQKALQGKNICVNCMHPGLVRTGMTNEIGFYSPDEAAETPLYLALDAPDTLRGAYVWFDRTVLDWFDYKANYFFKTSTLEQEYK